MSRETTDAQRKYSSYELEVLAVIEAITKFRVYLLGIPFKIFTEGNAFTRRWTCKVCALEWHVGYTYEAR